MTTMLEKAALAMFRACNGPEDPHDEEMWAATREDYLTALRAALQAIREPSLHEARAGSRVTYDGDHVDPISPSMAGSVFTAMIDAILAEDKA